MGPNSKESSFTLYDEEYIEGREAANKAYREGKIDMTPEEWQDWQDLQDDVK